MAIIVFLLGVAARVGLHILYTNQDEIKITLKSNIDLEMSLI